MYVVIGATGNTGSVVAKELLAGGQKVRAIGQEHGASAAAQGAGSGTFCRRCDRRKRSHSRLQRSSGRICHSATRRAQRGRARIFRARYRRDRRRDSKSRRRALKELCAGTLSAHPSHPHLTLPLFCVVFLGAEVDELLAVLDDQIGLDVKIKTE